MTVTVNDAHLDVLTDSNENLPDLFFRLLAFVGGVACLEARGWGGEYAYTHATKILKEMTSKEITSNKASS